MLPKSGWVSAHPPGVVVQVGQGARDRLVRAADALQPAPRVVRIAGVLGASAGKLPRQQRGLSRQVVLVPEYLVVRVDDAGETPLGVLALLPDPDPAHRRLRDPALVGAVTGIVDGKPPPPSAGRDVSQAVQAVEGVAGGSGGVGDGFGAPELVAHVLHGVAGDALRGSGVDDLLQARELVVLVGHHAVLNGRPQQVTAAPPRQAPAVVVPEELAAVVRVQDRGDLAHVPAHRLALLVHLQVAEQRLEVPRVGQERQVAVSVVGVPGLPLVGGAHRLRYARGLAVPVAGNGGHDAQLVHQAHRVAVLVQHHDTALVVRQPLDGHPPPLSSRE
jgi:hypothetical protein